jgi:hypothetical protein
MSLPRVYDPAEHGYRVRYAIRTILRDRIASEITFKNCFEMKDADEVIHTILRRGLTNSNLRLALESSHLFNLVDWLVRNPE